jgi:phosphatidylglycerophosphate synthase
MQRSFSMPTVDLVALIAPLAFWFGSFLVFAVRCAFFGTPRTARIDKVASSPYLPRIFMEFGYWMFTWPIALLLRLGVTANLVTFGSLFFTIVAAIFYGDGHFAVGGWILVLAFSCDAWDGILARTTATESPSGEFLDATIDRYNDLFAFFGLMYYYRNDALPLACAALALVGSTLTSYTRAKGESVGVDPNVGYMQRHERAVYLGLGTVAAPIFAAFFERGSPHPHYYLAVASLALMAILTNVTAIWRARVVIDGLRKRSAPAPGGAHPGPAKATPGGVEVIP